MFKNNFYKNIEIIFKNILEIPKYIIYYPLKVLYFHGPSLGNYGFWNGKEKEDICAQLTAVPAKTWNKLEMEEECESLLSKKFHSFYVSVLFSMYVLTIYNFLSYFWYRYFLWRPFIKDVKQILDFESKKNYIEKKNS